MFSATENIISSWDSYHHHHYHHYHDNHQLHHGHDHHHNQLQENPPLKLDLDEKKPIKVSSKTVEQDRKVVKIVRRKRVTREEATQMLISRVCSDCGTSKTPLWRSGPSGPKSLCNACGIRNRKRRRREFDAIGMMSERHEEEEEEEENEKVSLLLQREFSGKEEAEAALLLMALSCGLCVNS